MPNLHELLAAVLLLVGTFLIVLAGVGLIRFPDVFCRMHAAGKAGTLGVVLIVLGAVVHFAGSDQDIWVRGILAVFFQFLTAPAATHLLARAAYVCDYPLAAVTAVDELGDYLGPPTGTELLAITEREESKMLTRILVGLDNTPNTDAAVRQAIQVAQRHKAQLTGLVVEDVRALESVGPIPIGGSYYAKRLREHRLKLSGDQCEGALARFEVACQAAGVRYAAKRLAGDPFETFAAQARYHDLVVLSVQFQFYHDVIKEPRDPLGRLMKRGMRPLIAVAPDAQTIRQVVIAYNGSIESTMAMKQFLQLSPWPEVSAHLVWCGEESDGAQELLGQASAYCQSHGLAAEVDKKAARRREDLLDYATQRKADLIVMGGMPPHFPGATQSAESGGEGMERSTVSLFLNQ
jgi:monovalent cation/proton antiporter MnhG/PhaG subunit